MATSGLPPFFDRRKNRDRRLDDDPCQELPVDLYHRKRRKSLERRKDKTRDEQYVGYLQSTGLEPKKDH